MAAMGEFMEDHASWWCEIVDFSRNEIGKDAHVVRGEGMR